MPTYVLEGGKSITLPARPVTIRLQASNARARLSAIGLDGPVRSITPAAGLLVVPQVDQTITVQALPDGADRFGPGSLLNLTVGYESRQDLDPDRGVLNGLDVSGLMRRDIVTLDPEGDRIRVSVLGPAAAEAPLPPGAAMARDAAREILGTDQLTGRYAVDAVVAVDVSASMRPLLTDGTVAQVVDILAGVHRVIGRPADESLRACLVAGRARWLPTTPPERLTAAVTEAVADLPLTTGFRASEALQRPGPTGKAGESEGPRTVTWLITDGAPAEAATLAGTPGAHLVLVMPNSAREVALHQHLATTVVGLPDSASQPATFGSDRNAVTDIVASLVAPLRDQVAAS
ncbi:hypothetical protein ACQBAU_15920 [Propionibacteriaceae bacterium Y2011]